MALEAPLNHPGCLLLSEPAAYQAETPRCRHACDGCCGSYRWQAQWQLWAANQLL